jgi:RNA polymerase-binding transcription factor DksA
MMIIILRDFSLGRKQMMKHNIMVPPLVEGLEKERKQILRELEHLREALKVEVDVDLGEGDPGLVERDRVASLIQEDERKLMSLDRTLEQARQGLYGICERCHKPIDPARLEALPDTTLCIDCKRIMEQKHHHRHPPMI